MSRPIADVTTDMKKVIAELATIVDYVNGSIGERPRKYRKADGSESEQMALPTLQYYAEGRQGGKRIPRKTLPSVRRRVENGKHRKALLARPFFAPDLKALRDAKTPGTGRTKTSAGRTRSRGRRPARSTTTCGRAGSSCATGSSGGKGCSSGRGR